MPDRRQSMYPTVKATPKVAIPRLERRDNEPGSATANEKSRAVNACTSCRKRKVKCTGERPKCKNCEDSEAPCEYAPARKDRLKLATEHNAELVRLLKDLRLRVGEDDKKKIDHAIISETDDSLIGPSAALQLNALGKRPRRDLTSDREGEVSSDSDSDGSNDDRGLLDEDLLRSRESRATGFVGKNSEVQWLRSLRLRMKALLTEDYHIPYDPPGTSEEESGDRTDPFSASRRLSKHGANVHVSDSTFYLDSDDIDIEVFVNPLEMPLPETAEKLFDSYLKTVHTSFPILPKPFEIQFWKYYDSVKRGQPLQITSKWRAILNLVFAIGARFSHLINAEWQADDRDHSIYMSRAIRLLGLNDTAMLISEPDLLVIQACGLLSVYYLAIGHVSRAWIMIGISLRFALAVGLHLRNEDPSAPLHKKESLVRIWWGLHSVESLLGAITGRPCVIDDESCTVPLPILLPEEQGKAASNRATPLLRRASESLLMSNNMPSPSPTSATSSTSSRHRSAVLPISGSFLDARARISRIMQRVLSSISSPRATSGPWRRVQKSIASLLAELEDWAKVAMPDYTADVKPRILDFGQQRDRLLLGFHYYSVKILITRPCLCRIEQRNKGQSNEVASFNQNTAEACVQAAQGMTMLLPDIPNPEYIYRIGPWWAVVHHIMQAIAVFLLELFYASAQVKQTNAELIICSRKLIRWLHAMSSGNPIAGRALKVALDVLKCSPPHLNSKLSAIFPIESSPLPTQPFYPNSMDTSLPHAQPLPHEFQPPEGGSIEWGTAELDLNTYFGVPFSSPHSASPTYTTTAREPPPIGFSPAVFQNPIFFQQQEPQMPLSSAFANPFSTSYDQPNPYYHATDRET